MQSVMVRHDAKVRLIVSRCSLHGKHKDEIVKVRDLDAHLTVMSITHGKVSGYDSGVQVKYRYELVNPARDILENGALCDCKEICNASV